MCRIAQPVTTGERQVADAGSPGGERRPGAAHRASAKRVQVRQIRGDAEAVGHAVGDGGARLMDVIDHVRGSAVTLGQTLGRILFVLLDAAHEVAEGPEMAVPERRLPLALTEVVGNVVAVLA